MTRRILAVGSIQARSTAVTRYDAQTDWAALIGSGLLTPDDDEVRKQQIEQRLADGEDL